MLPISFTFNGCRGCMVTWRCRWRLLVLWGNIVHPEQAANSPSGARVFGPTLGSPASEASPETKVGLEGNPPFPGERSEPGNKAIP